MTTHVFIVDSTTFKVHLEYLFAGTGAKDNYIDFNNSSDTSLHSKKESLLVEMMADASRIRRDDQIIFYLQQNYSKKIFEGKFFGIFKAKHDWSFLDNNDTNQYLKTELKKSLTFRTLIEPYEIYSKGVTEWEALDEIKHIIKSSPNQMLWSLIYRKLKGNRGNTMITIYESGKLCELIRDKNARQNLCTANHKLSFDQKEQNIILTNEGRNIYIGRQEEINLLPRLIAKYQAGKSFESHLQTYIVQNIGKGKSSDLDDCILGKDATIEWIGNEVSCGVGMQRIDVMLSKNENNKRVLIPIELKSKGADITNTKQVQRYIDWIVQYYTPNRQSDIQPVLISKKIKNKNITKYRNVVNTFKDFNIRNRQKCNNLKYIEYHLDNDNLIFEEIDYNS